MFGLSFLEILVIAVVALLVFGPEKLPEIAKMAGKLAADLQRMNHKLRREFYNATYPPAEELHSVARNLRADLKIVTDPSALKEKIIEKVIGTATEPSSKTKTNTEPPV